MSEKNRNILINAIKDMPVRKPNLSNWDAISGKLNHIESDAYFSEQLSKLPGHAAAKGNWDKIAAQLPPASTPLFKSLTSKLIVGTIIISSIVTAVLLFQNEPTEKTTGINNSAGLLIPEAKDLPPLVLETKNTSASLQKEQEPPDVLPEENKDRNNNENVFEHPVANTSLQDVEILPEDDINRSGLTSPDTRSVKRSVGKYSISRIRSIRPMHIVYSLPGISLPATVDNSNTQAKEAEYAKNTHKTSIKLGFVYSYKKYQAVKLDGMEIPLQHSSYGLDFTYGKGRWFLRTGIAYLGWKDKADYYVDYKQNQLVYQYNYVDSALVNPVNGDIIYFTTEKDVFDSVPGQINDQSSYSYRLLQIPLLAGYRIFDRKNFSISVLGGVGFDIRLSGKQFDPVLSKEGTTITEINNSMIYRTANNWRIIGSIEFTYAPGRKWEVFAEPGYQYYMKSLYGSGNAGGTGLLNINAGLRYIFH